MSHNDNHLHDAEFGSVIARLEAERPAASALELDAIRRRVHGRVGRTARRSGRTEFMRSRLAILGMLVFGMVLSTGGAGLAVSGFTGPSGNAAEHQYGDTNDEGDALGEQGSGGNNGNAGAGDDNGGGTAGAQDTQPTRQVEAGAQAAGGGDEQLPFTGFAAIPILLGGVALLSTGLVMRRRTSSDT